MKTLVLLAAIFFLPALSEAAKACSYCGEMEKLKKEFALVKPEPMNSNTIDKQNELVDKSVEILVKASKKAGKEDYERIIPFFALVLRYDYQNLVGEELTASLKGEIENFFAAVSAMEKSGKIDKETALEIRTALGTAENVQKSGTDAT